MHENDTEEPTADASGTEGGTGHTDEIRLRLEEIQRRHGSDIRWGIGKHTAELAIRALENAAPGRRTRPSSKSRRRKRRKRML